MAGGPGGPDGGPAADGGRPDAGDRAPRPLSPPAARGSAGRRLAVLAALGALPWTVVFAGSSVTLVSPLALASGDPVHVIWVWELLARGGGLPTSPLALPLAAGFYLLAVASAAGGLLGREDPRLTGGLVVLAALASFAVAAALAPRLRYVPVPVGSVLALGVAWWWYGAALRTLALAPVGAGRG